MLEQIPLPSGSGIILSGENLSNPYRWKRGLATN